MPLRGRLLHRGRPGAEELNVGYRFARRYRRRAGPRTHLDDLPEKMRVHALARLLGRTSREVISALAGVGVEVRTAQSSIDRKAAEQVVTALLAPDRRGCGTGGSGRRATASPAGPTEPLPAEPAEALAPLFAPPTPLFQPPEPPARAGPRPAPTGARLEVEAPANRPGGRRRTTETAGPVDADDRRRRRREPTPAAPRSPRPGPRPRW